MIKDRKLYSLKNFRGIDKENKPLKVEPFRAADGNDFILDSGTIKTRPAIKYLKEPSFVLEQDDFIIDWHEFRNAVVYVTKKHIYIETPQMIVNDKTNTNFIIRNSFPNFNFEGKTPVFKEEKEALFIFGLDDIFVVSILYNPSNNEVHKCVLYSLKEKPMNPYLPSEDYYLPYDELPMPYEPLLFIGSNRVDDINLLSNVSKYSFFADPREEQDNNKTSYFLPTHYDETKHGSLDYIKENVEVTFYKNRFGNLGIVPVFRGRLGEDFEQEDIADLTIINATSPIKIKDTFFPVSDFQYFKSNDVVPVITPISEILGLKKSSFFRMTIESTSQNVFEFLLQHIEMNGGLYTENKLYVFTLPVQYRAVYKDENTNFIIEESIEKTEVVIYVELKKYEVKDYQLDPEKTYLSTKINEYTLGNNYPSYPTISETPTVTEVLSTQPIERANFSQAYFESLVKSHIAERIDNYEDEDVLRVNARLFEPKTQTFTRGAFLNPYYQEWAFSNEVLIQNEFDYGNMPAYPNFSNPNGDPVVEPGNSYIIMTTGSTIQYNENVRNQISNVLQNFIDGCVAQAQSPFGNAFAKMRIVTYFTIGNDPYFKCQSFVCDFTFEEGRILNYEIRQSMSYVATVNKQTTTVVNDLYDFDFDSKRNAFEVKIKNYFFDYNNEPSIDIKVKFEYNPDYNMVAKTTFGVVFGSENRLFLAGHPDYPNIDRYNVSNDLLGNNIKNQSYELSYFPSKNYRVLGGKGAINGYVVATDSQLYVTKKAYPNDEMFFVRERQITEQGQVVYREFKTNIHKTPLNHRCIVRFYNDILILAEDGLFGVEISSNVLTNERLFKLRSGFINQHMIDTIKKTNLNDIFVVENNAYMYMFVGTSIFVADSRYTSNNPNSLIENVSYEIVEWTTHNEYMCAHVDGMEVILLQKEGDVFYHFVEKDEDDKIVRHQNSLAILPMPFLKWNEGTQQYDKEYLNSIFTMSSSFDYIFLNPSKYSFMVYSGNYKVVGKTSGDYHIISDNGYDRFIIDNDLVFRNVVDGDVLYFEDDGVFHPFTVIDFESNNRELFSVPQTVDGYKGVIYKDISKTPLYIQSVFEYDVVGDSTKEKVFRLSPYKFEGEIPYITQGQNESNLDYSERVKTYMTDNNDYYEKGLVNVLINEEKPIDLYWMTPILDFGTNTFEKTLFKTMFYATKQSNVSQIIFGYKTMRRLKRLEDGELISIDKRVAMSNVFDFSEFEFNSFSLNTFNEFGSSLPTKENNFLYIQFIIKARGRVEINSIEFIYKNNRLLKSIG